VHLLNAVNGFNFAKQIVQNWLAVNFFLYFTFS